jgi:hypothetical protein
MERPHHRDQVGLNHIDWTPQDFLSSQSAQVPIRDRVAAQVDGNTGDDHRPHICIKIFERQ